MTDNNVAFAFFVWFYGTLLRLQARVGDKPLY